MRRYIFQPVVGGLPAGEPVLRDCRDDGEAIGLGLSTAFQTGCEVWEGYRLVGRFHSSAKPSVLKVSASERSGCPAGATSR